MNVNTKQIVRLVTLGGAAVLVVNSAMGVVKAGFTRGAIMPIVSIVVGVAAFNYAMASTTVTVKK
jgi:hypothetical protein